MIWHTPYTSLFLNFIYSFVSYLSAECYHVYKLIQITSIILLKMNRQFKQISSCEKNCTYSFHSKLLSLNYIQYQEMNHVNGTNIYL